MKKIKYHSIKSTTATESIQFYQRFFFSTAKTTLLKGVKNGNMYSFPGLKTQMVKTNYKLKTSTERGHLNNEK